MSWLTLTDVFCAKGHFCVKIQILLGKKMMPERCASAQIFGCLYCFALRFSTLNNRDKHHNHHFIKSLLSQAQALFLFSDEPTNQPQPIETPQDAGFGVRG